MARSEAWVFAQIGRAEFEDTKAEPLPERWIDLIRHLDEQDQQQSTPLPPERSERSARK
jgi:hypothetical protein